MDSGDRKASLNRQAFHDYDILERFEAGLVLTGTEIKSIRSGRADLRGSFAKSEQGELWLHGMHIAPYEHGGRYNQDPKRPRKLLLRRDQIKEIRAKLEQKGLAVVPLKLYVKRGWAKVELGLGKGKKKYDKRRDIIDRALEREAQRAVRQRV
jgi:SsrA-binding protein